MKPKQSTYIDFKTVAVVDGEEYPILMAFQVAHVGWEMDNVFYVIDYKGTPRLLASSHESFSLIPNDLIEHIVPGEDPIRNDITILEKKISFYEDLIKSTKDAIEMLCS